MKLGLKGKGGIKALLLRHGEKIGMALVAVCVALFIYKTTGHERLPADKQHDKLTNLVSASRMKIDSFTWERALELSKEVAEGETPPAVEAVKIGGGGSATVAPGPYQVSNVGFNRPMRPQSRLRTDPDLLTATDFEVSGSSALVPFIDEATRRRRALEERRREEESKKDADRLAAEARDRDRGGRNRGGEEGGRGFMGEGGVAAGMVDPKNPNRRMAPPLVQNEGIALQGDELVKVVYFATVLAKIPIEEQMKLYRAALENAKGGYDINRDRPRYMGYFVQRAEVTDAGQELKWEDVKLRSGTGKAPWAAVTHKTLPDSIADWPAEMEEIADIRYVHPLMTFPLPPIVGKSWGERAKLSEVQLQSEVNLEEELKNAPQPDAPKEEGEPDLFGGNPAPGVGPGAGGFGEGGIGRGGMGRGGFGGGRGFGGEEGGMRGFGGRGGGFMGEEGGMARGGMGFGGGGMGGARRSFDNMEEPFNEKPFWMFRFFDTAVEPGKRYRYRVKLVLADVNGNIPHQYLDRKVADRLPPQKPSTNLNAPLPPAKPLMTEWSEPSPIVSIPMAGEVRLAQATAPNERQFNGEPVAKLLVNSFDVDEQGKAIQAATEVDFLRGSVMNLIRDVEVQDGPFIDKVKGVKFRTGATLVDVRAGKKLPGDLAAPSKALVMDAGGRLSIRNDLTDAADVELHRVIFAKPDPNNPTQGGGFLGEGGFGGRGGFGGER